MVSDEQLDQRQQAARKHGIFAFMDRGEEALEPVQRSRYIELREQLENHEGREDYRIELAVHIAMIWELAVAEMRKLTEEGKTIWTSNPVRFAGTYLNTLIRLLDSFPKDGRDKDYDAEMAKIGRVIDDAAKKSDR